MGLTAIGHQPLANWFVWSGQQAFHTTGFFSSQIPCGPITPQTFYKNYNLFCCLKLHSVNNKQHWWNAKSWKFTKQKDLQHVPHLCHIKHALNRLADSCLISTRGWRGPEGSRATHHSGATEAGREGRSCTMRRGCRAHNSETESACSVPEYVHQRGRATAVVRSWDSYSLRTLLPSPQCCWS